VPGVGAITALAFGTAVDEPERFLSSAAVGAYFGLTPSKYASGETDYRRPLVAQLRALVGAAEPA
jgi:transposase